MSQQNGRTIKGSCESGGLIRFLRIVALIALASGALGSIGLMLWVGRRNPSHVLLGLFVIWDVSPFVALALADFASKRLPVFTRATLYVVMLILSAGSLVLYGDVVWRPRPQPAFMFLVVPLVSWLLMLIVLSAVTLISRKLSRRGTGA